MSAYSGPNEHSSTSPFPIVCTHCCSRAAPSLQSPFFLEYSTGFLPPLSTKSSAAAAASLPFFRSTEEPLLSFLGSSCLSDRFAASLAARRSFHCTPTNGFCLPPSGHFFSYVLKISKMLLPLLLACVRTYLRSTSESSGSIRSSNSSISNFISSLLSR